MSEAPATLQHQRFPLTGRAPLRAGGRPARRPPRAPDVGAESGGAACSVRQTCVRVGTCAKPVAFHRPVTNPRSADRRSMLRR